MPEENASAAIPPEPQGQEASERHTEAEGVSDTRDVPGEEESSSGMSLREHLLELRKRALRCLIGLILGFLLCYTVADFLYDQLTAPLEKVMPQGSYMVFLSLPEGFLVELRIAFIAGIFLSSPYIFYQIWAFVAPGLYREERRLILPLAALSAFFFIGGAAFCYAVVFPFAFEFFLGFSRESLRATPAAGAYLSFAIQLMMAFGLIFEMPLFSFFFAKLGLVTPQRLRFFRKYAILASFILAAVLTPPDVLSQLLMVAPLLLLYEISIFVASIARGKTPSPQTNGTGSKPTEDKKHPTP